MRRVELGENVRTKEREGGGPITFRRADPNQKKWLLQLDHANTRIHPQMRVSIINE